MRRILLAGLASSFLLAHLPHLPHTLEDIDSINFALGVQDFDVAAHQPHPPGYPVFILLARASTAVLRGLDIAAAEARALSILSTLSGALLIPLLFSAYGRIGGSASLAWRATAVAACAPLFWFTALRPLSDMTGLTCALGAQVLLLVAMRPAPDPLAPGWSARQRGACMILGAALAGMAAGVRSQTVFLTVPLLLAALVWPGTGLRALDRVAVIAAAGAGGLLWAAPLLSSSGGLDGYLAALGTQAGEDFAGVEMLWTSPSPRVAAEALLHSFVRPWGSPWLGGAVSLLAAAGVVRALWRAPVMALVLALAYAPYAAFHLLFQETLTVRYALPLVVPMAFLAVYAVAALGRIGLVAAPVVVAMSLWIGVTASAAYASLPSPPFAIFDDMRRELPAAPDVVGMHAVMRRVAEWERTGDSARVLAAPQAAEWLSLVGHWRQHPAKPIAFVADPARTDLALFDPRARVLEHSARWRERALPFLTGSRPGASERYAMQPPGWMLDRGWALTAEVGGVSAREGLGPHIQPSVAWVRARSAGALLLLGGRNLAPAGGASVRVTVSGPTGALDSWDAAPGFFFRQIPLAPGVLAGQGYLRLEVGAAAADGAGGPVRLSLEQFDLQSADDEVPMLGLDAGWYEPEYRPATGRSWRWMSERASLWLRPIGRDLILSIQAESPLRYFDRAPQVSVSVAEQEVARFSPSSDFTRTVRLPAALLDQSGGVVQLASDLWFSPADRGGGDARHLALRVYAVQVEAARDPGQPGPAPRPVGDHARPVGR